MTESCVVVTKVLLDFGTRRRRKHISDGPRCAGLDPEDRKRDVGMVTDASKSQRIMSKPW